VFVTESAGWSLNNWCGKMSATLSSLELRIHKSPILVMLHFTRTLTLPRLVIAVKNYHLNSNIRKVPTNDQLIMYIDSQMNNHKLILVIGMRKARPDRFLCAKGPVWTHLYREKPPSRKEAFNTALRIERSAGEIHY